MAACITDPRGRFWHRLPVPTGQLDISPDGRHLCFARRESPTNSSIWLCQLDGRGKKRLAREGGVPVWLDDQTVLYQTRDLLSVRTVDIHTLQDKEAFRWDAITTRGCAGSIQLTLDRKRLLVNPQNLVLKRGTGEYVHYSPTMDLYACDQNGKNVQVIWEDAGDSEDEKLATTDCHPVWLGTNRVVWCRHAIADNRVQDMAIVTCRLGETNFTALTGWRGYSYPLSGSPDGQRILYVTEDAPGGGNLELWTMKADGTGRQRVLNRKFGCDLQINARWVKRPQ
jgi:hypothetical protein